MSDFGTWNDPGTPRLLGEPWAEHPSPRGVPFSKDPAVIRFGGRYLLYTSRPPATREALRGWGVAVSASDDLVHWTTVGVVESMADYDDRGVAAAGAVVIGDTVHLFYQTYGQWEGDRICHATSTDGVTFTPNPANPVFGPTGDWTIGRAIDADVVVFGDRLLLAYATRDPDMHRQLVGTASAPLDSGFGPEAWTHHHPDGPALAPELAWETDCIEAPALRFDGTTLTMFYAGGYNNDPQQIGWATSVDGVTWTRGSDEPLVPNGAPGQWNSSESGHPGFFRDDDGQGYLFFQGNADHGRTWRIAATRVWFDGAAPRVDLVADDSEA